MIIKLDVAKGDIVWLWCHWPDALDAIGPAVVLSPGTVESQVTIDCEGTVEFGRHVHSWTESNTCQGTDGGTDGSRCCPACRSRVYESHSLRGQ